MDARFIRLNEKGKADMEKKFFGVLSDKTYEVSLMTESGWVYIWNEDGDQQTLSPLEYEIVGR